MLPAEMVPSSFWHLLDSFHGSHSSVGQGVRLITLRSTLQARVGPSILKGVLTRADPIDLAGRRSNPPSFRVWNRGKFNFWFCCRALEHDVVCVRSTAGRSQCSSISGIGVEHIVAIDMPRVRFPADAFLGNRYHHLDCAPQAAASVGICRSRTSQLNGCRFGAVTVKAHFLLGWALPFSLA